MGDVRRIRSKAAFAQMTGTAPLPASSGNTTRHRLNRGGNRKLNRALHLIAEACSVARALQPAMLVIEDVDLIAEDREAYPGQHPLLFQLLNEMDGLVEDLDVALLPIWGWGPSPGPGHLDPETAARAVALVQPRIAIPIHWGTFLPIVINDPPEAGNNRELWAITFAPFYITAPKSNEHEGKLLIVDCGVLFPEEHQPGVDLILPDFEPI